MLSKIFSLYDIKAGIYKQPFFAHNKPEAIRMLTGIANQPDNLISQYPQDFNLFELGEFNDDNGEIKGHDKNDFICSAQDLVQEKVIKNNLQVGVPKSVENHSNN